MQLIDAQTAFSTLMCLQAQRVKDATLFEKQSVISRGAMCVLAMIAKASPDVISSPTALARIREVMMCCLTIDAVVSLWARLGLLSSSLFSCQTRLTSWFLAVFRLKIEIIERFIA